MASEPAPGLHQPQAWAQSRVSPGEVIEAAESAEALGKAGLGAEGGRAAKQDHGQLPQPQRRGGVCCSPVGSREQGARPHPQHPV